MTVNDQSGQRSVDIEIEVVGSPEEVWEAIASGPGISSWFVPAEFEEKDGVPFAVKHDFGHGMLAKAAVTKWQPPHGWASQSDGWTSESPPIASEWTIESRGEGKCILRIVYSRFASTDRWDHELEGAKAALSGFLRTLQIYLAHFRGQRGTVRQCLVSSANTEAEAWETLMTSLGLKGLRAGQRFTAPADVPTLSGVVEYVSELPYDALLRLEAPVPGIAAVGVFSCPGTMAGLNFYLYGEQAADTFATEVPLWESWLSRKLPAPVESTAP